jgi:putative ABC transport system permease protein
VALESLWAHKLRSFLTLLGVMIAVTALIGVIAAVNGLNSYVAERLANFGVNVFFVSRFPIITNAKDYLSARRHNRKLNVEDYEYLRDHMILAEEVGAQDWRTMDVRGGNQELEDVTIRGTTANMIDIGTDKVLMGRFFTESEYDRRTSVAFIGADVAERFFAQVDPLGKTIMVSGSPFLVIGVAEKNGSTFGQSQDNFVYVPMSTLQKIWGAGNPNDGGMWVSIKCASPEVMEETKDQARALMRVREHLSLSQNDTFGIVSSDSVTHLWEQIFGGMGNASIGLVSVFMVIGGIVIMNIMLASVTERTHEIGIRKSVGARRRDILMQFLVESSVMAAVGGSLGVASAVVVIFTVQAVTPMPMRTPVSAVVLSIAISTTVGIFFGLWPALKAARLDPVAALRFET